MNGKDLREKKKKTFSDKGLPTIGKKKITVIVTNTKRVINFRKHYEGQRF